MSASYLIRFDDVCPTMRWSTWRVVEEILLAFGVKPILSVVPDNQDESLNVEERNEGFWDQVRRWQARGWTIGLHGYHHVYSSRDGGLVNISRSSEFSGLPFSLQLSKLQSALNIFRREGVRPDLWVAPGHSFDLTTLQVLRELGIRCVSDGFALYPYRDNLGMVWIPQQLWRFRKLPWGVWTICLHLNRWTDYDTTSFRRNVGGFAHCLSDVPTVLAAYGERSSNTFDHIFGELHRVAIRSRTCLRFDGAWW